MRNQDNYTNSKQFITDHLYIYDYYIEDSSTGTPSSGISDDYNILKMKIGSLDGPVTIQESSTGNPSSGPVNTDTLTIINPDTDVTDPMNHFGNLQNDLIYLDRYIRTTDNTLNDNELSFDEFWEQRINNKERFLNTGKEDGEQPYNQRPTLLSKTDFADLYILFKVKESNNEWETAFDIINKVTNYCIDNEVYSAESMVINHKTTEELEETLELNAKSNVLKNDYNYVTEMNKIYDEVLPMVLSVKPSLPLADPTGSNDQLIIGNLPEKRSQIILESNHSSHKGTIIESLGTGGYRFKYRDEDGNELSLPIDPTLSIGDIESNLNNDLYGDLEDNFNVWEWGHYYEEEDPLTLIVTPKIDSLNVDKNDLPSGSINPNDITLERFEILNSRGIVLNNLREYQIANNGTRNIIESMLNVNIPNLLLDKQNHLQDKKDQKQYYIDILKERLGEYS